MSITNRTKFRSLGDREQRLFMAKISDLILYNDTVFDEVSKIIESNQNLIRSRFPDMSNEIARKPVFVSTEPIRSKSVFSKFILKLF